MTRGPRDLLVARVLTLSPVLVAFPAGIIAVFVADADRNRTADLIAWAYSLGLFTTFTVPFWPLRGLRGWSRLRRVQSAVLFFVGMSYVTHLTWELGWLLLHDTIAESAGSWWAYPWWAYIDGGDARYLTAPTELVTIEVLSVCNGIIGMTGLVRWLRSGGTDRLAPLLFMATAVVHLYSASYYYLTEILGGFDNVDTTSFTDAWIKFGLANLAWVTMPWLVLWWGWRTLDLRSQGGPAPDPA